MNISLVVPVYNEEKRIGKTIASVATVIAQWRDRVEIIFVDDGSQDQTISVIKQAINKIPHRIISFPHNLGKGAAVREGLKAAYGDWIILFDADNATTLDNFDKIRPWLEQYDIIIGSRYMQESHIIRRQPLLRRVISRFGNVLVHLLLGLSYKDTQCGFKIISQRAAAIIAQRLTINRWGFDIELLTIAKLHQLKVKEQAVTWSDQDLSRLRAGRAAFNTFKELFIIRKNIQTGRYR